MTDKYTPKVGDTVKATLGDNVLYGHTKEPRWDLPETVRLAVDDLAYALNLDVASWDFEPWTPPVVFKPLTVVRLEDDALRHLNPADPLVSELDFNLSPFLVRTCDDYWVQHGSTDVECNDEEIATLNAAGKAEVVFGGVDE